jgi:mannose/fructose/N-acetylgalactosamine-specific phosphotransferase system component IID
LLTLHHITFPFSMRTCPLTLMPSTTPVKVMTVYWGAAGAGAGVGDTTFWVLRQPVASVASSATVSSIVMFLLIFSVF